MAHIELPEDVPPGILGLMAYRPATAKPLNHLAEVLLREDNSLSRGERELIAAYVSNLNDCNFCQSSHSAFAAQQLEGSEALVDAVKLNPATADISPKVRALLGIARQVQKGGLHVTKEDVEAARAEGATDLEIHDAVLIAAAFCMYNRYVDGLATWAPSDRDEYRNMAHHIVDHGYVAAGEALDAT